MPDRPPARANIEAALRAQATRTAIELIRIGLAPMRSAR